MKVEHGGHGEHGGRQAKAPNDITAAIMGAAIKVHSELGPGLLASAYEACLAFALTRWGHRVERQKALGIKYDTLVIDKGYRIDLPVDDTVVVELKSLARLEDVHEAQLLSYVRLAGKPVGLLMNFNVPRLVDGIRRVVRGPHRLTP
ncbi:MAG: GxxExxY protein [Opitutus sp.]